MGYLSLKGQASVPPPANATTAGKALACRMNRLTLQNTIRTWTLSHPGQAVSLEQLKRDGLFVPECPEGGILTLEGQRVHCSLHEE